MSLRFLIGRSGTGKTDFLLKEMIDKLRQDPSGPPILYIVPEQMTFLSEYQLVTGWNVTGTFRLQVYSFTRLAWRILQNTGAGGRTFINNTGMNMLLRRIMNENEGRLRIFYKSAKETGFIERVEKMLTEMKRYLVNAEELARLGGEPELSPALADKIHDLAVIYEGYERAIRDKYLAGEDYLSLLAEQIPASEMVREAEVYIDGFHNFTPQELRVIEQLMKTSRRVTVALTLDRPYRGETPSELSLFRKTGDSYATLYEMARVEGIPVEEDLRFAENRRHQEPSLAHLERKFGEFPPETFSGLPAISIAQAVNPRAEIEGVGRKIYTLVRERGYRFRDIAILVRDGERYYDLFDTILTDFQIPYHIDRERSMLSHPLIELIRSSLEAVIGNFRYDPLFRAIKTDLLFPGLENWDLWRERMDRLENYCLAYGVEGSKWTGKERWHYRKYRGLESYRGQTDEELEFENELNECRQVVIRPYLHFLDRVKQAETGKDYCTALFSFLEELSVPAKLEKLRMEAETRGDLVLSRQHEQVWDAVIHLLDQFAEILGGEKMTLKEFADILDVGLESLRFSIVPPALDQVIIANLERSRLSDVKAAFIIGLNEGVLPKKYQEDGILSDDDREEMKKYGITLAPSSKELLLDEEFLAYKAFTAASEYLVLSYPLADAEGKALLPSPYIKRVKDMFPEISISFWDVEPGSLPLNEQLEYLFRREVVLSHVNRQLQRVKGHEEIEPIWWDGYNLLVEGDFREKAQFVFSSLFFENRAEKLPRDTVSELYGGVIQGSVTRFEQFNSCPFAHFLAYGLRLEERPIYRLKAPDIGELFHSALKEIGQWIRQEGMSWSDLTEEQMESLVARVMEEIAPRLQNEILFSSNRLQFLKRKFEKIILRAVRVISRQIRSGEFAPVGLEVSFGRKGELPPFRFPLKSGITLELAGRIDRIDAAESERGVFFRIIDYKSSEKELNLAEVYYGLALQMLTYLDVVVTHSEKLLGKPADPAGIFYFHVHDPLVRQKVPIAPEKIEEEIFKQFKMKGLLLSDPEVVKLMDRNLRRGFSKIIPVELKKDQTIGSRSRTASEQEFSVLREYVRHLYQKTGERIADGVTDIAPYKMDGETPCKFCPFRAVCRFDTSLKENNYRVLKPLKPEEAITLMEGVVKE
jgi:DNA helicase/exodeoxyribonuclease V, subunit B (EC 3.1.11.5)